MKAKINAILMFIMIFLISCGGNQHDGQSGYQGVQWGEPVAKIKSTFGSIRKIDEPIIGIVVYKQESIQEHTIKSRNFIFKQGKLVEVHNMLSLNTDTWHLAIEKLNEKNGKYDDSESYHTILDGNHKAEITSRIWNMPKTKIIFRRTVAQMREYGIAVVLYDIIYRDTAYVRFLKEAKININSMRKANLNL